MQAILYGAPFAPLLNAIIGDICAAAAGLSQEIAPLAVETAIEQQARCARVQRLYVLPFDLPPGETRQPAAFIRDLFPAAEVINPPEVHELCWDKLATAERLVGRGIPVPDSLYTSAAEEVSDFVRRHHVAILKERRSCGGHGHVILFHAGSDLLGEARGRRFAVQLLEDANAERRLKDGVLTCPPPFYVQRMVGAAGARAQFIPGQVLRAYLIDGQLALWTERYRDRYLRPSDWIVNASLGAKYRLFFAASEEARKIALRTGDVLGMRVGVVDLIRTGSAGPYVLEADTDGQHMYIDRQFKNIPEYREPFDFDRFIAAALVGERLPTWGIYDAV